MKSHDLAHLLLENPNLTVVTFDGNADIDNEVTGILIENETISLQTDSDEETE